MPSATRAMTESAAMATGVNGTDAIRVEALHKSFGSVRALRGLDFSVPRGTVQGILGPNGAGKTTAVRVLTTLLPPDSGTASVEGYDVVHDAAIVRRLIALAGQATAIQLELTGRENLQIMGALRHLDRGELNRRADELLARFDLVDAADRPAKTYSGGMQRRLDLAASLLGSPSVIFLDEPTTGLDPHGRLSMWEIIRELAAHGTTILLTTQYLDEADELADNIMVIERGQVIAQGTSDELKDRVGGDVLEFSVPDRDKMDTAVRAVSGLTDVDPHVEPDSRKVAVSVGNRGSQALVAAVRALDAAQVSVDGLALRRPSLDDVFLAVTGHAAESDDEDGARRGRRRRGARPEGTS
jgi:ABC-2 type transport system ATP-binding protein